MGHSTLMCIVIHPAIAPELITQQLSLPPSVSQTAGERIVTPKGRVLEGRYKFSKWCYKEEINEECSLEDQLSCLIETLLFNSEFLVNIKNEGGNVSVFFNLSDPGEISLNVSHEILEKMSRLMISFGMEIFQSEH